MWTVPFTVLTRPMMTWAVASPAASPEPTVARIATRSHAARGLVPASIRILSPILCPERRRAGPVHDHTPGSPAAATGGRHGVTVEAEGTFRGRLASFGEVRALAEAFGAAMGADRGAVLRLVLVLEELFTNTVTHGYPAGSEGPIWIAFAQRADLIEVTYEDAGPPFDPLGEAAARPEDPRARPQDPRARPEDPCARPEDPRVRPQDPRACPEDPRVASATTLGRGRRTLASLRRSLGRRGRRTFASVRRTLPSTKASRSAASAWRSCGA